MYDNVMSSVIDILDAAPWDENDSASTLGDAIRRRLADEILSGAFEINQKLDEQSLADKFGVSRTPVREAIRQLSSAGLVEIRPRRGAVVVPVDPIKIGQAFEAAAELEALAAKWAASRANLLEKGKLTDAFEACNQALETNSPEAFATANRLFHDTIGAIAKNESLTAATRVVRVQTAPFQRAEFQSADERERAQSEHAEILSAICRQDGDEAHRAMKDHVLRASLSALRRHKGASKKDDEKT